METWRGPGKRAGEKNPSCEEVEGLDGTQKKRKGKEVDDETSGERRITHWMDPLLSFSGRKKKPPFEGSAEKIPSPMKSCASILELVASLPVLLAASSLTIKQQQHTANPRKLKPGIFMTASPSAK